jgi:hypothetical protein
VWRRGRRQVLEGRRQVLEGHRQVLEGRRQVLEGRRQVLEGRRQVLEGRRQVLEGGLPDFLQCGGKLKIFRSRPIPNPAEAPRFLDTSPRNGDSRSRMRFEFAGFGINPRTAT